MHLVVIGLSLSSSWGNGHATTYRALLRGLARRGWRITFLEQDAPWYAANRDLPSPDFARLELYDSVADLKARFADAVATADAVLVGSFVQQGPEAIDWALETARGPVAFYDIDTPVTLAKLERGEEEYLAARQIPHFSAYLSFTGGPTLDLLKRRFGARRAEALYCAVDLDAYFPAPEAPRRWRLGYLGTYSSDRQPGLERLLLAPARVRAGDRFAVAGPQYPADVAWPANVERIEHLPPARHREFYTRQDFTLNVTRADMIAAGWSPSVRLFEAAACATPIVSDRWDGLDALFPDGEAILIADTTEDVLGCLDLDEAARRRIGASAREIVAERHSADARAAELEAFLSAGAARREAAA